MNLKSTLFKFRLTAVLVLFSAFISIISCDKIDGPYREGSTAGIVYLGDDSVYVDGDLFAFSSDNSTPVKKVLAEDYTGMLCGNCPYVGLKLNDTLHPLYGNRLVVISVHAGFFANPCPGGLACPGSQPAGALTTDFRTVVSENWDAFFGNSNAGNPNGLIDRIGYPSSHIKGPTTWASNIQQRSLLSSPLAIRISNLYNPVTRVLKTAVQTRAASDLTATYKLSVVVVQDSVIDWQEWYPPHVPQFDSTYIHRNVLRTAINSSFGEVIADGSMSNGSLKLRAYSSVIDPAWDASHCHVIAFVYDASNYEVKQVEEVSAVK